MAQPQEYTGPIIEDGATQPTASTGTEPTPSPVATDTQPVTEEPVAPAMRTAFISMGDKTYEYQVPENATDEEVKRAAMERINQEFPDAAFAAPNVSRKPSWSMYDNMSQAQAQELYQQWVNSPYVSRGLSGLVFKDPTDGKEYIVPEPDRSYSLLEGLPIVGGLASPTPGITDRIGAGVLSGIRNVGELGASVIDLGAMGVSKLATGEVYNPDLSGAYNRNVPAYPSDSIVATGGELLAGLGVGSLARKAAKEFVADPLIKYGAREAAKTAGTVAAKEATEAATKNVLTTAATNAKNFVADTAKFAVRAIPEEAGMAAALSSNSDTLFIGPKAAFPLSRGLTADTSASEAEKIIKARGNILLDAIMTAPAANVAINGVTGAGRLWWGFMVAPFLKVGSQSTAEKAIVEQVLDRLASVRSGTGEATDAAKRDIIRLIEENKEVLLANSDNILTDMQASTEIMNQVRDLTAKGDTAGAQKLIKDYQASWNKPPAAQQTDQILAEPAGTGVQTAVPLDTMSALERGLRQEGDSAVNRQVTTQARGMRSGVVNSGGGAPATIERLSTPARQFEEVTSGVEQARGGAGAIEGARQSVVDTGTAAVRQTEEALGQARQQLADAERNVVQLIKEDPTFGAKIDDLSKASGINIYAGKNQAEADIVANVRRAYETMTQTKNDLYSAVRGGDVDALGLVRAMDTLQPGQLDIALTALPGNSQVGAFLNVTRRRMVQDANGAVRRETDGEAFERVSQWLYDNNVDYGQLYREIRPAVSQTAELMFAASDPAAKAGGQALRNFVGWIDGPALDHVIAIGDTEIAAAARNAKDYYVKEYAPFWRDGKLAEVADLYNRTVGRTSDGLAAAGQEVMPVTFKAEARNTLISTLNDANREYAGQVIDLLSRPEAGQNAKLVTDYILGDAVGGITAKLDANPSSTLADIDVADILGKLNQYRTILTENFPQEAGRISAFIDNLSNAKGNVEQVRGLITQAEEAAKAAKASLREGAISRFFNDNGVPNPNGYAVLEGIFKNPQGATELGELITAGQTNPLIRDGLQAAYARYIREKVLGTVQELGGNRAVKPSEISKIQSELNPVMEHGRAIFKDTPEVMGTIEGLLDLAGFITKSKNARAIAADPATAARMEASRATNRIVTAVFGVLSRRGAVIRNFSNAVIRKLTPEDMVYRMMDEIYSDPDKFVSLAKGLVTDTTKRDAAIRIATLAARAGINASGNPNYEEGGLESIVNEAVNSAAKAETGDSSIDQQTQDIFAQEAEQIQGQFGGYSADPEPEPTSEPTPYSGKIIPE